MTNPFIEGFLRIEEARKRSENVFTEAKELSAAQERKLDKNNNGNIDSEDLEMLRNGRKEEITEADGIFGDQTRMAMRQFISGQQRDAANEPNMMTNSFSPSELDHIASIMEAPNAPGPNVDVGRSSALNAGILRRGSSGDEVRQIQQLLVDRGYDLGPAGVDGQFGPATERAVRDFQTQRGLTVDGLVGAQTFAEFGDRDRISASHLDGVPANLNRTTPSREVDLGITRADGSSYGTQTVPGDPMGPLTDRGRTADVVDMANTVISGMQTRTPGEQSRRMGAYQGGNATLIRAQPSPGRGGTPR